ncbi:MAG: L-threonylcarbamoyladenylate synthase [Promethearchaeota archaeon]
MSKLQIAADFIRQGKLVVFPTDTSYGLGANITDTRAVTKIFQLKQRSLHKPIHIVVSSLQMAEDYAFVSESAINLAHHFLPGPLTLILRKKDTISDLLSGGKETIGIRMPDNLIALALVERAGVPITATSANISGSPDPYSVKGAFDQLGNKVDLYLDIGILPKRLPSTILDLTLDTPKILREGPIPSEQILEKL